MCGEGEREKQRERDGGGDREGERKITYNNSPGLQNFLIFAHRSALSRPVRSDYMYTKRERERERVCVSVCLSLWPHCGYFKLQALVYDIRPQTTAAYAIGLFLFSFYM